MICSKAKQKKLDTDAAANLYIEILEIIGKAENQEEIQAYMPRADKVKILALAQEFADKFTVAKLEACVAKDKLKPNGPTLPQLSMLQWVVFYTKHPDNTGWRSTAREDELKEHGGGESHVLGERERVSLCACRNTGPGRIEGRTGC